MVLFANPQISGGSFTGLTVSVKLVLVLAVPSLTVNVIVAVPFWFAAGVTVTVRLDPLPPNTMFAVGIRVGLEEVPLNVRLRAPVLVSSLIVRLAMLEIVGAVLLVVGIV